MEQQLNIVNKDYKFPRVSLIAPNHSFYLLIAAEIDRSPFPFFLTTSDTKKSLIDNARRWCQLLRNEENVIGADVFKATLIPPGKGKLLKERFGKTRLPKYDFVILIEVSTAEKLNEILATEDYRRIKAHLTEKSRPVHVISATNVKRIGDVNHEKSGVFLFNYFYADDVTQNIAVWEYTAGWFQQETGLDNSTVLLPCDSKSSRYKIINHCRWNSMWNILPSLIFKKSFHTYVLDNFYANKVAAMPILYKLA
jgi:hypothetical protein